MEEHHISVEKTARYFTIGELNENTREIWIVCHGYGQLASYFIQKFKILAEKGNFIIAPEGFHRYYLEGNYGRVGASWMTKEDRLNDIKDYVRFLDRVYDEYKSKIHPETKINVLGFSQGCATVSRWICLGKAQPDRFILYAGVFPPDLNFEPDAEKLKNIPVFIVAGNDDEFISPEQLKEHLGILKQSGISYKFVPFNGNHSIESAVLEQLTMKF